jgi:phosphohistidine phosphatase
MTLRLVIVRHAKAEPESITGGDHARPLAPRGREDARRLGAWLAQRGAFPALVLCSDAARTRATWAGVRDGMAAVRPDAPAPALREMRALYHAPPEEIARVLASAGTADPVMIVGHNPGIGAFAGALAADRPQDAEFARYPTAATTILDFAALDWAGIAPRSGRLSAFVHPRALR